MTGMGAFRKAFLNADTLNLQSGRGEFDEFSRFEARQVRYDILWSLYQNNAFWEHLHTWDKGLKSKRGGFDLYKFMRGILNPIHRQGEFWSAHLAGGTLDPDAGDGGKVKSCLPIEGASTATQKGIAKLWMDSRWGISKDNWGRTGSVLGDVGLKLVDDPIAGKVRMKVVHPGHLKWVDRDHDTGRITGYILEEWRYDPRSLPIKDLSPLIDPRSTRRPVRYNEEAWTEGGEVFYRTYLNGGLFDWTAGPDGKPVGTSRDARPEWSVPYPFVPLVLTQHLDVGLPFGLSEPHAMLSKLFEMNDLASCEGDQIRKILDAPWAALGCARPAESPRVEAKDRSDSGILYFSGQGVQLREMVASMPLDQVGLHIDRINAEIERDYPEFQMDIWATGDTSGRALRVARQRTEIKVQARRTGYDHALTEAQRMALAIGGIRGYEGYSGLGSDDPDDPRLAHAIGHRPVFSPDPLDDIEEGNQFWVMIKNGVNAGMPLELLLKREGWDQADIDAIAAARIKEQSEPVPVGLAATTTAFRDVGVVPSQDDRSNPADGKAPTALPPGQTAPVAPAPPTRQHEPPPAPPAKGK